MLKGCKRASSSYVSASRVEKIKKGKEEEMESGRVAHVRILQLETEIS